MSTTRANTLQALSAARREQAQVTGVPDPIDLTGEPPEKFSTTIAALRESMNPPPAPEPEPTPEPVAAEPPPSGKIKVPPRTGKRPQVEEEPIPDLVPSTHPLATRRADGENPASYIRRMILSGMDNDAVLMAAREAFDKQFSMAVVNGHRGLLTREGLLKPRAPQPARAASKPTPKPAPKPEVVVDVPPATLTGLGMPLPELPPESVVERPAKIDPAPPPPELPVTSRRDGEEPLAYISRLLMSGMVPPDVLEVARGVYQGTLITPLMVEAIRAALPKIANAPPNWVPDGKAAGTPPTPTMGWVPDGKVESIQPTMPMKLKPKEAEVLAAFVTIAEWLLGR
jgi:DNA polymerase-3 subunit gamma/tau